MIVICTFGLIVLTCFVVPFAQSIWGHKVFGYKTQFHCLNSLLMLSYSQGSLQEIVKNASLWAFLFLVFYYSIFVFLMHSTFHYLQQDAAKTVSLQTGFQSDLLEENEKRKKDAEVKKKAEMMNERQKFRKVKEG